MNQPERGDLQLESHSREKDYLSEASPMDRKALSRVSYFADCTPDILDEVSAAVRTRRVKAGEMVIAEGDACGDLFVVADGRVKVVTVSVEGREQVLLIVGPGRTFNDVAVFDGDVAPGTVEALEDGTIGVLSGERMRALVARHPAIALAATRILASRLRTMTMMVQNLAFRDIVGRVATIIRGCAVGEQPLIENAPHTCARITQQELAAMTGSVREVVQRALKTLETSGAIRLGRARIEILDPAALDQWVSAGK